jgi:putative mRNA 3-end processing factor
MPPESDRRRPGLEVEYLQGLHVVDSVLWLDAPRRAELCFLSHAHLEPGPGLARKVLTSEGTARLMGGRLAAGTTLRSPFLRRFTFGGLELCLHPAGHLPGSAQLEVRRDGQRLVYPGHARLEPGRLAEQARVLECDLLVLPAELGGAQQRFPPRLESEPSLVEWALAELGRGRRPVLFVPPLGLAQEVGLLLHHAGLGLRASRAMRAAFRRLGALVPGLPEVRGPGGAPGPDEVCLCPLPARGPLAPLAAPRGIPHPATALLGEAALEPEAARRWGVERAFAFTDRLDRAGLERYARESGARRVVLVHGPAEALAHELRALGLPAEALNTPRQLDLFRLAPDGQLTDGAGPGRAVAWRTRAGRGTGERDHGDD